MWHIHRKANCKNKLSKSNKSNKLILEEEKALDHIIFGFTGIMVTITVLSGTILFSSNFNTHADNVNSTNVAVNVASSCTMSGTGTSSHSATISNGTYVKNIGTTTLTVYCNDPDGFVIYAIGDGDSSKGVAYLDSSVGETYDINTGTQTSGNVSGWAMQIRKVTTDFPFTSTNPIYDGTTDNNVYGAVPTTYTEIARRTSSTDVPYGPSVPAAGSQLTTTYAAYISTVQPAGTYIGKVKYTMLHPNTAGTPKTLEESIADTLGTMVTDPTSPNYNATTVDGTTYYNMQNTASNWDTICTNATIINSTITLVDTRVPENGTPQLYTVAKLTDDKCWMMKNLNIAGGTALSYTDTDFDQSYTLPTTNGWTVNAGKLILPASSTDFSVENYAYVNNSNSTTCASGIPCYSYYSWDAATLGSGRTITTDNTDASYSVCPKGWHLPNTRGDVESDSSSDFRYLMYALGGAPTIQTYNSTTNPTGSTMSSRLRTSPLTFLYGGHYDNGSFNNGGSNGRYWSATSSSSTGARNLNFASSSVGSASNNNRGFGFSVRCIAGS